MNIQSSVSISHLQMPAASENTTVEKAAGDFAAVFAQKLLKYAWKPKGMMNGGPHAKAFYDQLSWQYARLLGNSNEFGIKDMIISALGEHGKTAYEQPETMDGEEIAEGKTL